MDKKRRIQYSRVQYKYIPILETMMKPLLDSNFPFRINALCKLAGIKDMRKMHQYHNNCFYWIFVLCEVMENNTTRCKVRPEDVYPTTAQTLDDYAAYIAWLLQPGDDKLVTSQGQNRENY